MSSATRGVAAHTAVDAKARPHAAAQAPAPCVHTLFEAQAARTPEAVAVECGGISLSYRELDVRAERLAHHLRGLGVGPEALVAVALDRSTDLVVGLLAVLKAGGAYVPLDPAYPADRLAFMLADAGAAVLLTRSGLLAISPSPTPASSASMPTPQPSPRSPTPLPTAARRPTTLPTSSTRRARPAGPRGR